MSKNQALSALRQAVELAGGQSALARKIGVKQANVWDWLNRAKIAPANKIVAIERATGVSREKLRPDIFCG